MDNVYISLNDFIIESKKSDSTIRKFIKEIDLANSHWVKKIKNRYYLNKRLLEYFTIPYKISFSYWVYAFVNRSNKPKCQSLSQAWEDYLLNKEWNYFGHVSYERETSMLDCMYLFDRLIKKIRKSIKSKVEIFYTSERNKIRRKGFHSHFVLYSSNVKDLENIKTIIDSFFRRNALGLTDIERYIRELDGVKYIMKEININKDGFGLITT